MTPLEIRKKAGKSRAWVAAMAGCSEPTARLYEAAGPEAVGERPREALGRIYASLAAPPKGKSAGKVSP